ncbi:uroporphyrinogen-III synthase [Caenimonas sp. SL110]|uniref:uroporphyrinogen-III synthase n=1 Tax=Caenimonas sp. SL110 TaxID=1450524 RepID=UPI0006533D63|nr:uroporphyrinogen-III synthase [Caenimonas sp. SL110]
MTGSRAVRVIVTRPGHEAPRWVAQLGQRGFDAVALPLIDILPAPDPQQLHAARASLATCRAVMFVSGNAVRHFFGEAGHKLEWPQGLQAWATGPGTRQALIDEGVAQALIASPDADSAQFDSETLWTLVSSGVRKGDEVMIVRGADADGTGRDWLSGQLAAAGANVRTVVAYARGAPRLGAEISALVTGGQAHVWLFSSSQAIANLQSLLPGHDWSSSRAVATHPRIAQAARSAGFGVVCESRPDMDAVSAALESLR